MSPMASKGDISGPPRKFVPTPTCQAQLVSAKLAERALMCVPEVLPFGLLGGEQVCFNSPRLRRKRVPAGYARGFNG
jgi:hypothetical protein